MTPQPLPERNCVACGKPFQPLGKRYVYCGPDCYRRHHNTRNRNAPHGRPEPRICPACGATFQPRTVMGVYCSRRCYKRQYGAKRYWDAKQARGGVRPQPVAAESWVGAPHPGVVRTNAGGFTEGSHEASCRGGGPAKDGLVGYVPDTLGELDEKLMEREIDYQRRRALSDKQQEGQ
jgi:predicted nucleic acid-binding Zn ribbon protein